VTFRLCVRISRTGASRWSDIMAITAMSRAEREKEAGTDDAIPYILEPVGNVKVFRKSWARLIQKIGVCPRKGGDVKVPCASSTSTRRLLRRPGIRLDEYIQS
jgi:hypothetical protein